MGGFYTVKTLKEIQARWPDLTIDETYEILEQAIAMTYMLEKYDLQKFNNWAWLLAARNDGSLTIKEDGV